MNFIEDKHRVNCQSCAPPEKDASRMLLQTETCIGVLRTDQHGARGWLGRAVYYVKGHLNPEEATLIAVDRMRCEMIHFMACQRLFGATRGNYAEAGNKNVNEEGKPTSDPLYHHPHRHVLPRYQNVVEWRGKRFVDHTFFDAMELSPTPSEKEKALNATNEVNIPLTPEEIAHLKTDIQKEFVRMHFDETIPQIFRPTQLEIANAYPSQEVTDLFTSLFNPKN